MWVSPVDVAPKPSGDIRLCVDRRRANEGIIRERLPIQTIDKVLESLSGSAVFSKLDLRWGFHQIELDPESRDITAFATHDGIFRYKRLSFGVNTAPEKYQHIITQSMAGQQGWQTKQMILSFIGESLRGRIGTYTLSYNVLVRSRSP